MIGLYLDDIRIPIELPNNVTEWIIVRNYEEFKMVTSDYINKNHKLFDIISFDNDLGLDSLDGIECGRWLIEYCIKKNILIDIPITIHSDNIVAVDTLMSMFNTYKKFYKLKSNVFRHKWKHDIL